jgi:lipoprotein-anchoring transpeptidase ErfK/SrfK
VPRFILVIAIFAAWSAAAPAQAGIVVTVDKTAQRLTVEVDGVARHTFPVSTARRGYRTPNGNYKPQWLARKWYSTVYDGSPMPFSIFFNGGYAIHGSYEISHLGSPASHGCVRLHPDNAAVLFALVQANAKDTQIIVTGEGAAAVASERAPAKRRPSTTLEYSSGGSTGRNPGDF